MTFKGITETKAAKRGREQERLNEFKDVSLMSSNRARRKETKSLEFQQRLRTSLNNFHQFITAAFNSLSSRTFRKKAQFPMRVSPKRKRPNQINAKRRNFPKKKEHKPLLYVRLNTWFCSRSKNSPLCTFPYPFYSFIALPAARTRFFFIFYVSCMPQTSD